MTPTSSFRTRVKICGLTRAEDIDAAVSAGADALGFVMWPGSPRVLDLERLAALSARVPAFVTRVGLFVDQDPAFVRACEAHLDVVQFHGDETPAECGRATRPWVKALRMRGDIDLEAAASDYAGAKGLLLDAYKPGVPGGTGETFDWSRIPASLTKPVILAGGLDASNVGEAIRTVRPFAVDVSGGIEQAKGIKDPDKIHAFVRQVFLAQD
ncbi:phosphoribosylanthranilate isomerase [Modicisalibacter luteus]|uniref:N-(5'-phosphoribosyl)anthranilate isomerase n=1 Tax=Modicisalibacter luteus TaxID=453962 RepID=A0ABV7M0C7_9GAMM|nr:phosphoribosylanthranilate isomerase [Halomonas lutea]GHA92783.1 N-(5'-phosphoribosyl)anthranilate isomerase [Halomonas lutea]